MTFSSVSRGRDLFFQLLASHQLIVIWVLAFHFSRQCIAARAQFFDLCKFAAALTIELQKLTNIYVVAFLRGFFLHPNQRSPE